MAMEVAGGGSLVSGITRLHTEGGLQQGKAGGIFEGATDGPPWLHLGT